MSKLIGRRVVVNTSRGSFKGQVGTIVRVSPSLSYRLVVVFYGHDSNYCYEPDELSYLNNKPVVLS